MQRSPASGRLMRGCCRAPQVAPLALFWWLYVVSGVTALRYLNVPMFRCGAGGFGGSLGVGPRVQLGGAAGLGGHLCGRSTAQDVLGGRACAGCVPGFLPGFQRACRCRQEVPALTSCPPPAPQRDSAKHDAAGGGGGGILFWQKAHAQGAGEPGYATPRCAVHALHALLAHFRSTLGPAASNATLPSRPPLASPAFNPHAYKTHPISSPTRRLQVALLVMVGGAIVAGLTDLTYNTMGYIWVSICVVSTAVYLLLIKKLKDLTGEFVYFFPV